MLVMQWILGVILILSSLGVILAKQPVRASLSFLMTLLTLAAMYLEYSAEFIAVMQILVYAGAILVIFMFVIVLFQDAHQQLAKYEPKSSRLLLIAAASAFIVSLVFLGQSFAGMNHTGQTTAADFGSVEQLGQALYVDFFFPFEAVILLFLVAVVGALYIGRKRV